VEEDKSSDRSWDGESIGRQTVTLNVNTRKWEQIFMNRVEFEPATNLLAPGLVPRSP